MISVILVLTLLIWGLAKYIFYIKHMEKHLNHLKTSGTSIPFIGNTSFFTMTSFSDFVRDSFEFILNNDTPMKASIGPIYYIALDRPEDVRTILMSPNCLDKPYTYGFYPLPLGLLTQRSGAEWKPVRKLMNPMFNLKTLQSFLPIFNEKTKNFVKDLESKIGNAAFDVMPYANTCTLDAICSTIMGLNIDLHSSKGKEFIHSMSAIFDIILIRAMRPWTHLDFVYKWTKCYTEEQKHLANLRHFTNYVFKEETKSYSASDNNNIHQDVIAKQSTKSQLPIIPMLYEGKLSEEMVKQQIEILLMAGYETTAFTISYAILMLAMHPKIQEETFKELRSVYSSQDEDTTYDHIQKLDILDRVLKETMRLFPIAAQVGRTATADIPVSKCVIPKGSTITITIFTMHRRQDIWGQDAEEFNPDHFLPENVQKRHPFAFIPFSGGPRNCIGYQYAMFSLKVMLSAILRNFVLSSDLKMSNLELNHGIVLQLQNKHLVTVERRKW